MTRHHRALRCLALPAISLLSSTAVAAPATPSLAQAQTAMDRMFDDAIADRPASDSSRLVAAAFRPRLQALNSCIPLADAATPTVDCIVTAQAGPEPVHRLLRFNRVQDQWALQAEQRGLPVPAPPLPRVRELLRASFAARMAAATDARTRTELERASRSAEVFKVEGCDVGDEAPVIECQVSAGVGTEHGQQRMAFTWARGRWESAPQP